VFCPFCRHPDSRVVDSREADDGAAIRRRRSCPECGRRFTTVETAMLVVLKRNGVTEPFSREKVMTGVRKACQGRPVDENDLAQLAQQVEEGIRATGAAEIASDRIGREILTPLRALDEVAYLRFASVYCAFESLEDFEREITGLRAAREAAEADLDNDLKHLTAAAPPGPRFPAEPDSCSLKTLDTPRARFSSSPTGTISRQKESHAISVFALWCATAMAARALRKLEFLLSVPTVAI